MQKDIFFIKKFEPKNRDTQKNIVHLFYFYIRAPYTYTKYKKRENGERAFKKNTWLIREGGWSKKYITFRLTTAVEGFCKKNSPNKKRGITSFFI